MTRAAIAAWQNKRGLPETGFLNESQLLALHEQAAPTKRGDQAKAPLPQQAGKGGGRLEPFRAGSEKSTSSAELAWPHNSHGDGRFRVPHARDDRGMAKGARIARDGLLDRKPSLDAMATKRACIGKIQPGSTKTQT